MKESENRNRVRKLVPGLGASSSQQAPKDGYTSLENHESLQVVNIRQRSVEEGSRTFSNFLPMPFLAASASVGSIISHSVTDAGGIYLHSPLFQ